MGSRSLPFEYVAVNEGGLTQLAKAGKYYVQQCTGGKNDHCTNRGYDGLVSIDGFQIETSKVDNFPRNQAIRIWRRAK